MIFYLPRALEFYGDTFARAVEEEKVLKGHTTYKWLGGAVVRLCGDEKKWLSPENFIEMHLNLTIFRKLGLNKSFI